MAGKKITHHLQDEGSSDCGPVCSFMVLDYFGKASDKQDVIGKIERCHDGTDTFANAITVKSYGLNTEIVTANPKLFTGDFIATNPDVEEIKARCRKIQTQERSTDAAKIIGRLVSYLDSGGGFSLKIPDKKIIIEALKDGKLIIASVFAQVLGENEGGYHFVVIGDYKYDKFLVLNPWPQSRHQSWEDCDEVLFAIHTSTLFDYDNGAIIIVGDE